MRGLPAAKSAPILLTGAMGWDGKDKNYLESIGLGAENVENAVWQRMKISLAKKGPSKWTDDFAKLTWRLWPSDAVPDLKARALDASLTDDQRKFACESLSFINDKSAADALFEVSATPDGAVKAAAMNWLFVRGTGAWSGFGLKDELKKRGIYDPDKIELQEVIVPAKPTPTYKPEDVLKLTGDSAKGQVTAQRCVMCHHIGDAGPNYAPDLRGWVSRQGVESAARSIVDPSADIAHGFDGSGILLKNGHWIDGLIRSNGDPLIVTTTGGLTQLVPKDRIQGINHLDRSLMLSADQLGLTAQDVADVIAWLKGY
jgi:putative heme-binding domain-containing protein